jgi:hypothetical protein
VRKLSTGLGTTYQQELWIVQNRLKIPVGFGKMGHILVDGFRRWQVHSREGHDTIRAEDLGNLVRSCNAAEVFCEVKKCGIVTTLFFDKAAHLATIHRTPAPGARLRGRKVVMFPQTAANPQPK